MTPLVDVAFLLLTFFMFATTASSPNIMEIAMPEAYLVAEFRQSKPLLLSIRRDGRLFHGAGPGPRMRELKKEDLKAFTLARNAEKGNDLIIVLKVDPTVRYGRLIDVLDELNLVERELVEMAGPQRMKRERRFTIMAMTAEEKAELDRL